MQDTEARTTETSESEGRLKSGAGCQHGKKKCLKCAISKHKDGKGGPGYDAPGYGAKKPKTILSRYPSLTGKAKKPSKVSVSIKMKGMKSLSSAVKSLSKKGPSLKAPKPKSLKSMLKGIIKQ